MAKKKKKKLSRYAFRTGHKPFKKRRSYRGKHRSHTKGNSLMKFLKEMHWMKRYNESNRSTE